MSWRTRIITLVALALLGVGLWRWTQAPKIVRGTWGIDAVVTRHAAWWERILYGRVLAKSGVGFLRERDVGVVESSAKSGVQRAKCHDRSAEGAQWHRDVRRDFRDLKKRGFKVVAFATLPFKTESPRQGSQLPEDLLQVYAQGKFLGREFAGLVDAWEMVGEPDIGFCTDLPDRVAAYQKALYLGLKAGAAEAKKQRAKGEEQSAQPVAPGTMPSATSVPLVLMGALGMPPGPWLERAAANGLLDYTDAYNFHFYGHAKDMTGVIAAHGAAIATLSAKGEERRAEVIALSAMGKEQGASAAERLALTALPTSAARLPMWITEAGIEAVDRKDFLNPLRRQLQADFTISTARQALAAEDVAVFMPFILVHEGDPYAMTLSPWKTFPAWDAYAKFTRENPWPKRALSREPRAVSPVVLQWLPDNLTTVPRKVSGSYRFRGDQPIKGELRLYNFGDAPVKGRLEFGGQTSEVRHQLAEIGQGLIEIPVMGMIVIPLEFAANTKAYFRETWSAAFVEDEAKGEELSGKSEEQRTKSEARGAKDLPSLRSSNGAASGEQISDVGRRTSVLSFGLEAWAKPEDFIEESLPLRPLSDGVIRYPQIVPYKAGEQVGVWSLMNELKAEPFQVSGLRSQVSGAARFWIERENTDPLAPTMAVAAVNGLPSTGFLRLQLDKPMANERKVLVVLVDDRGQRYTIWENFGADYYGSRSDIWLNLEDFHADFWGPCSEDYRFRAERIREVHLRFYLDKLNDPVQVGLTLLKAK